MASEITIVVEIGTIISTIFLVMFTIIAYQRYRQKRTQLSRIILIAFIFFSVAMIVTILSDFYGFFITGTNLIIYIPYLLLIIGTYYLFAFSRVVFLGEHEHMLVDKLVIVMTGGSVIFGILRYFDLGNLVTTLRVLWLIVYTGIIVGPILFGALKARRRIPEDDPHRANFLYIAGVALAYLGSTVGFLLDTIFNKFFLWELPTIFYLVAMVSIVLAVYCAQRGFFATVKTG